MSSPKTAAWSEPEQVPPPGRRRVRRNPEIDQRVLWMLILFAVLFAVLIAILVNLPESPSSQRARARGGSGFVAIPLLLFFGAAFGGYRLGQKRRERLARFGHPVHATVVSRTPVTATWRGLPWADQLEIEYLLEGRRTRARCYESESDAYSTGDRVIALVDLRKPEGRALVIPRGIYEILP